MTKKREQAPRAKKNKKKKQKKIDMSLSECVTLCLGDYFENLGEQQPSNLFDFVLKEVEAPMLKLVLERTSNNQSQAAEILGLNRGTLRKKLKQYDLI